MYARTRSNLYRCHLPRTTFSTLRSSQPERTPVCGRFTLAGQLRANAARVQRPLFSQCPSPGSVQVQRGVSLLEVMIAVLVLAVGVLGAANLQLSAIRYNASAGYSTQASLIASDVLDRMRANPGQLNDYVMASVTGECTAAQGGASIAKRDMADFIESVTCRLPSGTGRITVSDSRATITISWSEARTRAGAEDSRFITSSVIR